MSLDADAGSACFLFYLHGKGPGSGSAASARAGNVCQVMRPRIRLALQTSQNPLCSSGMKPGSPLCKHYTFAADKLALPDSSSK